MIVVSAFDHLVIIPVAVWCTSSVGVNNSVDGCTCLSHLCLCACVYQRFLWLLVSSCNSGSLHPSGSIWNIQAIHYVQLEFILMPIAWANFCVGICYTKRFYMVACSHKFLNMRQNTSQVQLSALHLPQLTSMTLHCLSEITFWLFCWLLMLRFFA